MGRRECASCACRGICGVRGARGAATSPRPLAARARVACSRRQGSTAAGKQPPGRQCATQTSPLRWPHARCVLLHARVARGRRSGKSKRRSARRAARLPSCTRGAPRWPPVYAAPAALGGGTQASIARHLRARPGGWISCAACAPRHFAPLDGAFRKASGWPQTGPGPAGLLCCMRGTNVGPAAASRAAAGSAHLEAPQRCSTARARCGLWARQTRGRCASFSRIGESAEAPPAPQAPPPGTAAATAHRPRRRRACFARASIGPGAGFRIVQLRSCTRVNEASIGAARPAGRACAQPSKPLVLPASRAPRRNFCRRLPCSSSTPARHRRTSQARSGEPHHRRMALPSPPLCLPGFPACTRAGRPVAAPPARETWLASCALLRRASFFRMPQPRDQRFSPASQPQRAHGPTPPLLRAPRLAT
jgi:hypothetical protein